MLRILIVEDEPLLAKTLKYLIELNPRFEVTEIVDDLDSALRAVEDRKPDLALVDLQLARGSTGFGVAARLNDRDVPCLFTTGRPPAFPMPDLALGCLMKPFNEDDIVRALKTAEDTLRGRERLRPSIPENLQIYSAESLPEPPVAEEAPEWVPALLTSRRSLRRRLSSWWHGTRSAIPLSIHGNDEPRRMHAGGLNAS